jgi:hypothetical protein
MKKLFFFAVLAVALAGFGMQTGIVHAQSMTTAAPVSNAQLEQELQVAKATLINLEMQQGSIPAGDDQIAAGTGTGAIAQPVAIAQPSTNGLTPAEVGYFTGLLSQLTSSLSQLEATLVANPNMNSTQVASISTMLGGMQSTLLAMSTQIAQDENGSNIAMTAPSAGVVAGASTSTPAQVVQTTPATTPAANTSAVTTVPASAAPANTAQSSVQPSSFWSFAKSNWPVIVIILLVIAILAILFWPESETKAPVKTVSYPSAPSAPKVTATATSGAGTNTVSVSATSAPVDPKTIKTA